MEASSSTLSMIADQQPWLLKARPLSLHNHHDHDHDHLHHLLQHHDALRDITMAPSSELCAAPASDGGGGGAAMARGLECLDSDDGNGDGGDGYGDGYGDEDGDDTLMRDRALEYISEMLMDENMEDRKCMMQECTAYQALLNGFIQDLQGDLQGGDLQGQHPAAVCGGGVVDQDGNIPPQAYHDSHHHRAQNRQHRHHRHQLADQEGGEEDYSWIDDVLLNEPDPATLGEIRGTGEEGILGRGDSPPDSGAADGTSGDSPAAGAAAIEAGADRYSAAPVAEGEELEPAVGVSFVNNEDLGAERHAKFYADWPARGGPADACGGRSNAIDAGIVNAGKGKGDASKDRKKQQKIQKKKKKKKKQGGKTQASGGGGEEDLEEVDLRGLLVDCAQAIGANNLRRANEILRELAAHASPCGTASQRLAHYFAEALVARLSGTGAQAYTAIASNRPSAAQMLKAYRLMVEVCPGSRLSHYFANHNILRAAQGAPRLHIVDYGILYGVQWPCLISALADRRGGPPFVRITGIDRPQPGANPAERIEETGKRLAEYARAYRVPFEFRAVARNWEDVDPASHLRLDPADVLVVNCIHRLRHLMDETGSVDDPDRPSPRRTVLRQFQSLAPRIALVGVMNASMNAPFFVSRFREALYHYSSKFDMMETTTVGDRENAQRLLVEREIMGRDILNVVACEGRERVERPETYRQWQDRLLRAGLEPVRLDRSIVHKAKHVVASCYHKDFTVHDDTRWMLVGWKGRIVEALSAWKPSSSAPRS